jgi:lipopolysaccharide export system protein LptC
MERRTLAIIFALATLAVGSQILVWIFRPHDQAAAFVGPPRSDYTLTNFTIDALDEAGKLSFRVSGPRLAHKAEDGSVYVTTPDYVMLDNSGNTWKGKSESAWVNKDGTIMKLEGAVDMHRIPTATVTPVQMVTSDLTVTTSPKEKNTTDPKPREKRMETAALVTITDPGHTERGIGMKADLGLKTMELLSDVHAILLPASNAEK